MGKDETQKSKSEDGPELENSSPISYGLSEKLMEDYLKGMDTQGRAKLQNYFEEITKTEAFEKKITSLRKKYLIPSEGFAPKDGYRTYPPEDWVLRRGKEERELRNEVRKMCEKHALHFLYWTDSIQSILFYNEKIGPMDENGYDLCLLVDLQEEAEEPFGMDIQEADNTFFPLAIRISPYATQRDILDFVKKKAPMIKHEQERYIKTNKGVRIGHVKKKKERIQLRNELIYQNRNLPRKEIMRKVSDEFNEILDYGHIGKIISLMEKKRKEL